MSGLKSNGEEAEEGGCSRSYIFNRFSCSGVKTEESILSAEEDRATGLEEEAPALAAESKTRAKTEVGSVASASNMSMATESNMKKTPRNEKLYKSTARSTMMNE